MRTYEPDSLEEEFAIIDEERKRDLHDELTFDAFKETVLPLCTRPAEVLDVYASVGEVVRRMQRRRVSAVAITDHGRLVGIVTERDLVEKVIGRMADLEAHAVSEIMTRDPDTLRVEDLIAYLMNKMHVGGYRHVPIVSDAGEPLHMLSVRDLVGYLCARFERDIACLPPVPYHGEPQLDVGYG